MLEKIRKFDKIFNCQKCNKTLWILYFKLPDKRIVCPICYDEYIRPERERLQKLREQEERERQQKLAGEKERQQKLAEEKERQRKLAEEYIKQKVQELIDKDLSELIFTFFQKKYFKKPSDKKIEKLRKLLTVKYKQEIKKELFFKIVHTVYLNVKEEKDMEKNE